MSNNSLKLLYRNEPILNHDIPYCEDHGDSPFIKALIKQFKSYIVNRPYLSLYFTPSLNNILDDIELNIFKNGDKSLNDLKFMKKILIMIYFLKKHQN